MFYLILFTRALDGRLCV